MPGSGPNDFYLNFGSNARAWANGLAAELEPAEAVITRIQAALNGISAHAAGGTSDLAAKLAKSAAATGAIGPASSPKYDNKVSEASSAVATELQHSAALMAEMITGLKTTVTSLGRIDDALLTAQRRIAATGRGGAFVDVTGAQGRPGAFVPAGTRGASAIGSDLHDVQRIVRQASGGIAEQAVRAGQSIRSAPIKLSPTTESALARISAQSLDQAAADRIVHAIEAQTAALRESLAAGAAGRGSRSTPEASGPPPATAPAKAAPLTAQRKAEIAQETASDPRRQLQVEEALLKLIKAQGAEADAIEEVTRNRNRLAATVAELDRAEGNLTHAEQRAARKAEAQQLRDTLPSRTRSEEQLRQAHEALIRQVSDSDFAERTKRGGDITKTQLQETANAFGNAGIPVGYNTKTTNAQFAEMLTAAKSQFDRQYHDTVPDSLKPTGHYLPEDRIAEEVQTFLGDVNSMLAVARGKLEAIGALDVNRAGGGGLPVKGLPEYGSGTFGAGVEGDSLTTRSAVINAREFLKNLDQQAHPLAVGALTRGIGKGSFDPYSSELSKGIEGTGEQATAYRLLLSSLRELTTGVDKAANDFYDAGRAMEESKAFIDRARGRVERNQEELGGTTDPARQAQLTEEIAADERRIEEAWGHIARNSEKLASFSNQQAQLFNSPEFQRGYTTRGGVTPGGEQFDSLGYDARLGYNTAGGTRGAYNQRVLAASVFTPQDRQQIKNALAEAIVGLRTGIGTRENIRNIPGLTQRDGILQPVDFRDHSIENIQRLRYASQHVGAAQADVLTASPEEFDAALHKLENAATRAANIIQEMFHVAPPIATFMGEHSLRDPGNIESEYRRQLVRDDLKRRQEQSFGATEPGRLKQAQDSVSGAQAGLAKVLEGRAAIEERAAAASAVFAREQEALAAKLGPAGQAEVAALEKQAAVAEAEAFRLTKGLPTDAKYQTGGRLGLLQNARLGQEGLDARQRQLLLGGAEGPLPNVRHGAPQGPLGGTLAEIEGLDAKAARARAQADELAGIDSKVAQEHRNAQKALVETARAEQSYTKQLEASQAALRAIADRQQQVRQIDAARAAGLKKPDGSNITRKDILAAVPGITQGKQITEILGPARKPARDKQLEAADAKIAQALDQTLSAEERKAKVEQEATKVTRELTSAEQSRVDALKAQRAALQAQPHTRADVKSLQEQAAAAEKALSSKRGLVTRYTNAGDEEKAAAAREALAAAEAEAQGLREQATAARAAKEGITEVNAALKTLGAGRGSGRGGVPPTAGGTSSGGGDDESILRRILGVLEQIHGTLQGGLNLRSMSGGAEAGLASTPAARARALEPTSAEVATVRGGATQEQLLALAQDQRQREQGIGGIKPSDTAYAHELALEENATRKVTEAEIERARSAQVIERSMSQLSAATAHEVEVLRQLNATGAEATAIAEQEARVFAQVSADMGRMHASTADRAFVAQQALRAGGSNVDGTQLASVARNARASNAFADVGAQYGRAMGTGVQTGFQRIFGGGSGFFDRILHTTGTFLVRNFAAGFVFGISNELQRAVTDAIKTQQTFVRLSSTLSATGKDVGNLRSDLQHLSSQYGVALNDMYDTAAKLAGVFSSPEELLGGTKTVAQLTMISEGAINAEEAVGSITSIWAAFQDELSNKGGAEHIADVATSLQNLTGVNIEDTVEGVARLTGLAKQMNISFDETATFVAQISRETNTSGATAGEQLSRILQQAQSSGGQTALKQALGADVFDRNTQNGAINYGNILKELVGNWDKLSKAEQANLTHSLAGTRQAATFAALMDNGAKTLSNLTDAQNSQGAASERMTKLMHTLSGELARLRSNFQNVVNELVQAGLLDFLGAALEGVNQLIGGFAKLLSLWNELGANNQAIGAVEHLAATLLGAYVALRTLLAAARGIRGAVAGQGVAGLLSGGIYGGGVAAAAPATLETATSAASPASVALRDKAELRLVAAIEERASAETAKAALVASGTASEKEILAADRRLIAAETEYTAAISGQAAAKAALATTAATEAELTAANQGLVTASLRQVELKNLEGASEGELIAANQAVIAANVRLTAAVNAHAASEAVASEASLAGGAGGLLGKFGGLRGLAGGAGRLATRALPYAIAAGFTYESYKKQFDRADAGLQESGGRLPAADATGAEARAAAKAYSEAFQNALDAESKGFFGTGVGPSLTKIPDSVFRPDTYDALHQHQDNLEAISLSLKQAAGAMDNIARDSRSHGGPVEQQTFTSFDTETLNAKLQDLTDHGQSAAQQLRELNDVLFATGKVAHEAARGKYQVGGRTTDNLGDWLAAHQPGLLKAGDKAGVDITTLSPGLRQALGIETQTTGLSAPSHTAYRPVRPGEKGVYVAGQGNVVPYLVQDGPATAQVTTTRNPRSAYTAKNTLQAINQTEAYYQSKVAPDALAGAGVHAQIRDLRTRGFDDEAKQLQEMHKFLVKFFSKDRDSFKTLIGASELNHKDAKNLIDQLATYTEGALNDLPETDLKGREALLAKHVAGIRKAIAKTTGHTPSQFFVDLQAAENALVEGKIAELDKARIAAQAADHSKAGLRRAAAVETQKAVRFAIKHGAADALAEIIQLAGKAGRVLAIAAIRKLQEELDAYNAAKAGLAAITAAGGAAVANAIRETTGGGKKPDQTGKQLNQLLQAALNPTGATNQSDWNQGIGVPGLDDAKAAADAAKADAAQLRADELALKQARLGVASAYADARGDAVASARIQVKVSALALAGARADLAAAKTQDERLQAQAAIYAAQAQMIAAHAAVAEAESALISSRFDVSIALAEAAGRTVQATIERARQAQAALRAALRKSHGENTADVNAARAAAISAEAAVRDAKLQDELDTIDFNLQMGRITQSSAIHALQHILKTEELTKAQRRQLLLQIKGMKDELSDSQWNFGDIKLPTPYQMRRYIEQRREQFRNDMDAAAIHSHGVGAGDYASSGSSYHDARITNVNIDGADLHQIKKILKEVIGGSVNVRTTAPRRGNR